MLSIIAQALHGMAAAARVGGIFFADMALRPAANETLDTPQRARSGNRPAATFSRGVWVMIFVLPVSGHIDLFTRFGGLVNNALYLKLMHGIGISGHMP